MPEAEESLVEESKENSALSAAFQAKGRKSQPSEELDLGSKGQRARGRKGDFQDSSQVESDFGQEDALPPFQGQAKKWPWASRETREKGRGARQTRGEKDSEPTLKASVEIKRSEKKESPFFVLSYDFTKIPDTSKFHKRKQEMGNAYQKYRSMLVKAQEFTRRKMF